MIFMVLCYSRTYGLGHAMMKIDNLNIQYVTMFEAPARFSFCYFLFQYGPCYWIKILCKCVLFKKKKKMFYFEIS